MRVLRIYCGVCGRDCHKSHMFEIVGPTTESSDGMITASRIEPVWVHTDDETACCDVTHMMQEYIFDPTEIKVLTDDPNDPRLAAQREQPVGQHDVYLVLSDEERAKGFVRPVRRSYRHVGERPKYGLRDLTPEEHERYDKDDYYQYETYPLDSPEAEGGAITGRFWTKAQLIGGCNAVTTMGIALAETYARNPTFYGATFCAACNVHKPVAEFVWDGTREVVGS